MNSQEESKKFKIENLEVTEEEYNLYWKLEGCFGWSPDFDMIKEMKSKDALKEYLENWITEKRFEFLEEMKLPNLERKGVKILYEPIERKLDAFFYEDQEEILNFTIKDKNGKEVNYRAIVNGDVYVRIDDDYYKNYGRFEAIEKYELDDMTLKNLENEGRLEWTHNNWFEIISDEGSVDTCIAYDNLIDMVIDIIEKGGAEPQYSEY